MFEFLFGVVTHTPAWVWVLFIFLISRGIKARRPATVTLERLAMSHCGRRGSSPGPRWGIS
ncbi:MAG: hypothetical protein E7I10_00215 [Enterobacter asburiae]|nr:hypothetical protein [Enterobacter asburiae]